MSTGVQLQIAIPQGFAEMPLQDIDQLIATTETVIFDVAPATAVPTAQAVLPVLGLFLNKLVDKGARYCGMGKHVSADGTTLITSWLVVSVYETAGEQENPHLALKGLAEEKAAAGEHGDLELIDVDGRPMMFFERVVNMPAPQLPAFSYEADTAPVFQLEAVVPAPNSSAIAAIEFSTAFVTYGPEFRAMLIDMARSVDFRDTAFAVNI